MSVEQEFFNSALSAGIPFSGPIVADGLLQRSHIKGHKNGTKNGAYVIFQNGSMSAGWGMDHTTGHSFKWRTGKGNPRFSLEDRASFNVNQLLREQKEAHFHQKASGRSKNIWNESIVADCTNAYLQRKQVNHHGSKTGMSKNLKDTLIVPLYSADFEIVSLQFIQPDGTKRFLSGGKKKGCFWWLGHETNSILIAEGFATAASLHEHTGLMTFIAFDAGNLVPVAQVIRQKYPSAEIIIAGDNDLSGVGQLYAKAAALAIGGNYIIPRQPGTDWNDELNGETGGMQ